MGTLASVCFGPCVCVCAEEEKDGEQLGAWPWGLKVDIPGGALHSSLFSPSATILPLRGRHWIAPYKHTDQLRFCCLHGTGRRGRKTNTTKEESKVHMSAESELCFFLNLDLFLILLN